MKKTSVARLENVAASTWSRKSPRMRLESVPAATIPARLVIAACSVLAVSLGLVTGVALRTKGCLYLRGAALIRSASLWVKTPVFLRGR